MNKKLSASQQAELCKLALCPRTGKTSMILESLVKRGLVSREPQFQGIYRYTITAVGSQRIGTGGMFPNYKIK